VCFKKLDPLSDPCSKQGMNGLAGLSTLPAPIVHHDPGDDSTYLDGTVIAPGADTTARFDPSSGITAEQLDRLSTAPHAELERRVDDLEEYVEILPDFGHQSAAIDGLYGRTDKLAQTVAHLAVAHVGLRAQIERSWRWRFFRWFRENVYAGPRAR
jgi:hypothetical protein